MHRLGLFVVFALGCKTINPAFERMGETDGSEGGTPGGGGETGLEGGVDGSASGSGSTSSGSESSSSVSESGGESSSSSESGSTSRGETTGGLDHEGGSTTTGGEGGATCPPFDHGSKFELSVYRGDVPWDGCDGGDFTVVGAVIPEIDTFYVVECLGGDDPCNAECEHVKWKFIPTGLPINPVESVSECARVIVEYEDVDGECAFAGWAITEPEDENFVEPILVAATRGNQEPNGVGAFQVEVGLKEACDCEDGNCCEMPPGLWRVTFEGFDQGSIALHEPDAPVDVTLEADPYKAAVLQSHHHSCDVPLDVDWMVAAQ